MGLQVTAEGVETESQRLFLVAAKIDEMQGYIFARPVDEACLITNDDNHRSWSLVSDHIFETSLQTITA